MRSWSWASPITCVLCVSVPVLSLVACEREAGPRADADAERACRFGSRADLDEFCDQSQMWRDACERFGEYDAALDHSVSDCAQTGFPVALGECDDLRVIERSLPLTGTLYYYDPDDGDLVGIRSITDHVVACPEAAPRAQSEPIVTAGRAPDGDCDTCHLCGVAPEADRQVCAGALAEPYVEQCLERYDFAAGCGECACGACYPWTFSAIEDTALAFHECVSGQCPACAQPGGEDAGAETDAGI